MKLTDLVIIFAILDIALFIILGVRTENLDAVNLQQIQYNKALDNAIDDGTKNLVELGEDKKLVLNKDRAVEQFYNSLFSNFGVLGDSRVEEQLKEHIPIILVTDEDGFYILYSEQFASADGNVIKQKWSEKIPYAYEDGNLIIHFTLGDYITVYDSSNNQTIEGEIDDVKSNYPDSFLSDPEAFDLNRRNAIIGTIEKNMNYYINQYNNIAYQFGITYHFWLPRIDKTDWYRTIDDRGMLVIFQGYPYSVTTDTYNRYAFGGARIKKSKTYFITVENGIKYYHKSNCSHINKSTGETYYSKEECALEGAFPCPDCNP